ncbi:unnamed protein product [Mytilus coruscus]|uniref:Uncharacterized protein n=1 Tax=Mytilus coruscus TaxID=42192 RepID=A0A6J8A501_MYTCO|nr:unnamed protein product [Mytilus coruscus]
MPCYNVKPSEILYSQVSIANKFKNGRLIGEVLDDILDGSLSVQDIPMIQVKLIDGKYVSADNRRLWILKELERLHQIVRVEVRTTRRIDRRKSARTASVKIRGGGPGGKSADVELKYGSMSVKDLPMIKIKFIDDKYVSADNRQLWILKELERFGHLEQTEVIMKQIDPKKSARTDHVKIRGGGPGGRSTDFKQYDCQVMIMEE